MPVRDEKTGDELAESARIRALRLEGARLRDVRSAQDVQLAELARILEEKKAEKAFYESRLRERSP
jgi:hypothetical protein